jgi:hypothetical protein
MELTARYVKKLSAYIYEMLKSVLEPCPNVPANRAVSITAAMEYKAADSMMISVAK